MKEFVILLFPLLISFPLLSLSKTICSRRQYTISNSNFYQRIETPTAVGCIERCIENSDYCKSVVYVEQRESTTKMKRFCQLYGVNSESRSIRIKPEANYEPKTTLYEILDECPSDLSSSDDGYSNSDDIIEKISPELKSVIRNIPPSKHRNEHFGNKEIDLTVTDDIHAPPDFEKLTDFGTLGVSGSSFSAPPQYPFSPSHRESSSHSKSAPDRLHPERDPIPIQPVSISHAGQGGAGGMGFGQSQASQFPCFSQNCRYQSQFSQSYPPQPFQSQPQSYTTQPFLPPPPPPPVPYQPRPSGYPCPAARRGDPCAPKPRCGPPPLPPCESYAAVEKITTELPKPYWSEWSPAGTCSVTCGTGVRQRKRFCSTGRESDCRGDSTLEEDCELPECDIWSEWSSYSPCSASCGGGTQERSRYCKNGRNCVGPGEERRTCADIDCPHWASWSGWHECSASCGQGMAKRSRDCLPIGSYDCPGDPHELQSCELRPCPEWAPWQQWTECTKSCDGGERQRKRECLHGSVNECPGPAEEHILCNQQSCPEWTQWTFWSQCSTTCGDEGTRLRNRQCQFEGFPSNLCIGTAQDQSACQLEECPYWGEWTSWTACTASCGHGQQTRSRKCQPKSYGCQGGDREMRFCQNAVCPYWDQWGEWGGCSVTCGRGHCERRRRCVQNALLPNGVLPSLDELETIDTGRAEDATDSNRKAALKDRLIERAQQLQGSKRNGVNDQKSRSRHPRDVDEDSEVNFLNQRRAPRRKTSNREESDDTAIACVGPEVDRKECDAGPCCDWSVWASWSGCNSVCGTGSKVRSRVCQVDVGFGGLSEASTDFQPETLLSPFQSGIRPIRPQISMMRGKRQAWNLPPRPQTYITPPLPPTMDPRCDCPGRSVETEVCTASECPTEPQIDPCSWSSWSEWCGCSGNCQQGLRARTRYCNQEEDATRHRPGRRNFGACDCPGEKVQTQDCLPTQCSSSSSSSSRGRSSSSRPKGVLFAERDSSMPKERISEIGEFGIATKKKKNNNNFERNEKPDDFIIKNDKSLEIFDDEEEDEVTSCSWSDWSEWTKCGTDFLKQRTRFCVGLKGKGCMTYNSEVPFLALINNCECRGATMQQTSCRPDRDGHNFKPPSAAVLSVSRDILNDKLSSIDKQQHDEVHSDIPELPKTKIRPLGFSGSPSTPSFNSSASSSGIRFLSGSDIITAASEDDCTWSEWKAWSECDAACGEEGERKRKRECPCASCNGGITTEIEICKGPPCSFNVNNSKKNPFD